MSEQTSSTGASSSLSGRWTVLALSLVIVFCITLIGLSGYVKYELDRAELALGSPETRLTPEQKLFDRLRSALGYGGFIGTAQTFAGAHDPSTLPEMKSQLKQAEEAFSHAPDNLSADTRHDLQAILQAFDTVMQKAEDSTKTPPAPDFTINDLMPLYASLPVLDARIASALAASRNLGQGEAEFWATLLTVLCWCSLIIAAALAAGMYLVLRDRNSAPMRALAQSVKNMARGDLRTPVWGMERQDSVGELARCIDMARFHFCQLPDMSLLSENGPVRIRFEGNTRSLFEAMMRVISRDSEAVHTQATTLTEAVQKQQETLAHVVERVEAVLQNVEKRAVAGDHQVRQALQGMLGSAESLKNAQAHAADQLNRIVPHLQERTQSISDIAQLTGKQVAQVLQSLIVTERGLRSSADQSEEAIRKFSSTADTLGERLFGAVNLLQASGKVLAETTATVQDKFDEAIGHLDEIKMPAQEARDSSAARLESAVASLENAQSKLDQLLADQAEATRAQVDLLVTQSSGLLTQTTTASQTLSTAADRLRDEQAKLGDMLEGIAGKMEISAPPAVADVSAPSPSLPMLQEIKDGIAALEQSIFVLQSQMSLLKSDSEKPQEPVADLEEKMRDHWYQMAAQIEATRANLAEVITQQTDKVAAHLASLEKNPAGAPQMDMEFARDAQRQMLQQTEILNELIATLGLLDAHMQELRMQVTSSRQMAS